MVGIRTRFSRPRSKTTESHDAAATWAGYLRRHSPRKNARVSTGGEAIARVTSSSLNSRCIDPRATSRL